MKNVDSVDEDQTAHSVQCDLDLDCQQKLLVLSSVGKEFNGIILQIHKKV